MKCTYIYYDDTLYQVTYALASHYY